MSGRRRFPNGYVEIAVAGAVFATIVATFRVAMEWCRSATVVAIGVLVAAAVDCSCGCGWCCCLLFNGVIFVCFGLGVVALVIVLEVLV